MMPEDEHPKFTEAMDSIERLQSAGQADPEAIFQWLLQAVEYAPESLKAEIMGIVYRKGRLPALSLPHVKQTKRAVAQSQVPQHRPTLAYP